MVETQSGMESRLFLNGRVRCSCGPKLKGSLHGGLWLWLLLSIPWQNASAWTAAPDMIAPVPSAEILESQHAVVGEIVIDNANIFDPTIPGEDRFLYRLANSAHFLTRPKIIERQLLFRSGDAFQQRLLEESERILRSDRYLHDAVIEPIRYEDGKVDILVHTTDVWTLDPRLSFGRSGGENSSSIGLRDSNLLGTGIYFGLYRKSGVDRDSTLLRIADQQLGKTWFGLVASYSDNSDGSQTVLEFERPFYSLDSKRSSGLLLKTEDREDSLYDRGEKQATFRHQVDQHEIFAGISRGLRDGWVDRYTMGMTFDEHRFSPAIHGDAGAGLLPQDRKFVYPYFQWERLEDRFEETEKHDQIGVTEDRFLGTRLALRLGYAPTALGSLDDAFIMDASASMGFGSSESDSLTTSADYHTRLESGDLRDSLLKLQAVYHHRHSDNWLLHLALNASHGTNLDLDHQMLLGGDTGLRGFPLRYQGGDSKALLTIEERIFTDWYPFRLAHIGAALFFDAGRTWGVNPVGDENLGWLEDVGFGFRFGNSRSGIGRVVHLDFAFPLNGGSDIDSMQILFEGKTSF